MHQWFIRFFEFAEFSEFLFQLVKTPLCCFVVNLIERILCEVRKQHGFFLTPVQQSTDYKLQGNNAQSSLLVHKLVYLIKFYIHDLSIDIKADEEYS